MAEVKWIKIVTDIFDDDKIKIIEGMPDADTILVIWFKLLCLAGKINCGGFLMLTKKIPYNVETLALVFGRPLNTVRLALNFFENHDMIDISDGLIAITNWEKHQQLEKLEEARDKTRLRVQAYRERQRKLLTASNEKRNALQPVTANSGNATEQDKDKDIRTTTTTPSTGCCTIDDSEDQAHVLIAATNAGFPQNKSTRSKIMQLCDEYGSAVVLAGIDACVDQSNTKLSYLRGCCVKIQNNTRTAESDPFLPKDHEYMEW